jgi:hypothetical protein
MSESKGDFKAAFKVADGDRKCLEIARLIYRRLGRAKELPVDANLEEAVGYLWSIGFQWTQPISKEIEWYVGENLQGWLTSIVSDERGVFLRYGSFEESRGYLMRPLRFPARVFVDHFERMGLFAPKVIAKLKTHHATRDFFEESTEPGSRKSPVVPSETQVDRDLKDFFSATSAESETFQRIQKQLTDAALEEAAAIKARMQSGWRPIKLYALAATIENYGTYQFDFERGIDDVCKICDLVEHGLHAKELKRLRIRTAV